MGVGTGIAIAGGIGALGSIGGSLIGANASESAAQTAAGAQDQASQLQYQEWLQQQANMQPWLTAGTGAVNKLSAGVEGGKYKPPAFAFNPQSVASNPDYQFTEQQGTNALLASGAAAGNYGSGNMGTALEQFGQGNAATYENQYYNQALSDYNANVNTQYTMPYNQMASLAGVGQTAANSLANTGQAAESNIGAYTTGAGNALAAGTLGAANAYTSGLNSIGNNIMSGYGNYLNQSNMSALLAALGQNNSGGGGGYWPAAGGIV